MTRNIFKNAVKQDFRRQILFMGVSVAMYWYSTQVGSNSLRLLSIIFLLSSQILLSWNLQKKIRSRILAINSRLTKKETWKALLYGLTPVTIIPFWVYLLTAKSGSQKGVFYIKNPIKILLSLAIVGLILFNRNFERTSHIFFSTFSSQLLIEYSEAKKVKVLSAQGLTLEEILSKISNKNLPFLQKISLTAGAFNQMNQKKGTSSQKTVDEFLTFIKQSQLIYFNRPTHLSLSRFNPILFISPISAAEIGLCLVSNEWLQYSLKKNLTRELKGLVLAANERHGKNADSETSSKLAELNALKIGDEKHLFD